ncbi:MAG: hypothetical protein J6104_05710 [Methanomicrobium sp.]|jgi:DNA-binding MarR family transcriptional regulator|nr:hypothetical protein [Methanomicrobium sp.]
MRDEDLDWKIYHILVAGEKYPVREIIDICGVEKEDVLKSLTRLEKNCLIEIYQETQDDGSPLVCARVLSLQETIFRNQIRCVTNSANSPVIVENGVIKENPNYKRSA